MKTIGIADTTFSRYNMGNKAEETIAQTDPNVKMIRYTVPGMKDLGVAAKKLIEEEKCDIVIACGMVGKMPIDKQCGHEASQAIMLAQMLTNTHVLEVFVHEDERETETDLVKVFEDRVSKHAINALDLLKGKTTLTPFAGTGRRQGDKDAGAFGGSQ